VRHAGFGAQKFLTRLASGLGAKAAASSSASSAPGATTAPWPTAPGCSGQRDQGERQHRGQLASSSEASVSSSSARPALHHVEEQRVVGAHGHHQQQAHQVQDAQLHAQRASVPMVSSTASTRGWQTASRRGSERSVTGHQQHHAQRTQQGLRLRFAQVALRTGAP
jgi:hypothetical protein